MPDYSHSKIYCISAEGIDGVYIGATTTTLAQRMANHRQSSSTCRSKPLIDTGKAVIELVEDYPCNSKEELDARERYWIENIRIALNERIPGRTYKEYRAANREQHNARNREYAAANREQRNAYNREYHAAHREQKSAYNREYRAKKKGTTVDGPAPAVPEADSDISRADGLYSAAGP